MIWLEKQKMRGCEQCDVIITEVNDDRKSICFKFKNNSYKKITTNRYVMVGIDGNKLYFREADAMKGWKISLSSRTKQATGTFKLEPQLFKNSVIEKGMYNLEFDSFGGLYYIDFSHKLNEKNINWRNK